MKRHLAQALILIGLLAIATTKLAAQSVTQLPDAVQIDGDDIGGVVTSRLGPEAGVWVLGETGELGRVSPKW